MIEWGEFEPVGSNDTQHSRARLIAASNVDLESLLAIFQAGDHETFGTRRPLFQAGRAGVQATVEAIRWFEDAVARGEMSSEAAMNQVIGQGHHRVLAVKA